VHRIDNPEVCLDFETDLCDFGNRLCFEALIAVLDLCWPTGCPTQEEIDGLARGIFGYITNRARRERAKREIDKHSKALGAAHAASTKHWHDLDDQPVVQRIVADTIHQSLGIDPGGPRPTTDPSG
jgi:hypothetical protein